MSISKSLGAKILAMLGVLWVAMLILGVTAYWSVNRLEQQTQQAYDVHARKNDLIGRLETDAMRLLASHRAVLLWRFAKHEDVAKGFLAQATEAEAKLDQALAELEPLLQSAEGRQSFVKAKEGIASYNRIVPGWLKKQESGELDAAAMELKDSLRPLMEESTQTLANIHQIQSGLAQTARAEAESVASFASWLNLFLLLGGAAAGAGSVYVVRKNLARLQAGVSELSAGAQQVASASRQVSSVSQSLAQGASEQAASLEETSASTEEINSMTQRNADNARQAAEEAVGAEQKLAETNRRLEEMLSSMREINASSEKIGKIIKVIDEIAFQTNILALNAAVEAARAGEAGMGFAVVADEVRTLAQRCAQAARDTSELIAESIRRSAEGKSKLDEVAASVGGVVENAGKVKLLANEVSLGSQEQARGISQIAKTVSQMQQLTQTTAASAEEGASAGEEMSSQAETLMRVVRELAGLVGASGSDGPAPPPERKAGIADTAKGLAKLARHIGPAANPVPETKQPAGFTAPKKGPSELPLDDDFRDF